MLLKHSWGFEEEVRNRRGTKDVSIEVSEGSRAFPLHAGDRCAHRHGSGTRARTDGRVQPGIYSQNGLGLGVVFWCGGWWFFFFFLWLFLMFSEM